MNRLCVRALPHYSICCQIRKCKDFQLKVFGGCDFPSVVRRGLCAAFWFCLLVLLPVMFVNVWHLSRTGSVLSSLCWETRVGHSQHSISPEHSQLGGDFEGRTCKSLRWLQASRAPESFLVRLHFLCICIFNSQSQNVRPKGTCTVGARVWMKGLVWMPWAWSHSLSVSSFPFSFLTTRHVCLR